MLVIGKSGYQDNKMQAIRKLECQEKRLNVAIAA